LPARGFYKAVLSNGQNYKGKIMAKTEQLLELIPEYSEAFQDPESAPQALTPPEAKSEMIDEAASDETTNSDWCQHYLLQLEYEPSLMAIAASFLSELADVASLRKHLANEPVRQFLQTAVLDLPETYARQSTPDCPSGACPIEH
jgi:hypothetical protein